MSKTVNMKQRVSRGNFFHALEVFSIIFVTAYVEVKKTAARMGTLVFDWAMYMYYLRCKHLPNNN